MPSAIAALVPALLAVASPEALPFKDGAWSLKGPSAAVARFDGRDVVEIGTGTASRPEARMRDGVLELDVMTTRRRSFVYVYFRVAEEGEREEVYLRPHKSGLPDALQYAPVFQGQSAWQLYHGKGKTAAVEFEPGVWTHVRLVVQGTRAALFLGADPKPALVVDHLAREPQEGSVGLGAFLPPGTPGDGPVARFSNVTLRRDTAGIELPPPAPEPAPDPRVVTAWAVSAAFAPRGTPTLPDGAGLGPLRSLPCGKDGLLELHRHVRMPEGKREAEVVAGLRIGAATEGIRAFDLGFSDKATVFLNGRPLFTGDASYSFDAPRREGLIGFDQARLYLPLVKGDNELRVIVSDSFGGFGLMGRFADRDGLEVEAR